MKFLLKLVLAPLVFVVLVAWVLVIAAIVQPHLRRVEPVQHVQR